MRQSDTNGQLSATETWPSVDAAIVSLLSATDGLRINELIGRLREMGTPYEIDEIAGAVTQMAMDGRVSWCREIWLQKRRGIDRSDTSTDGTHQAASAGA